MSGEIWNGGAPWAGWPGGGRCPLAMVRVRDRDVLVLVALPTNGSLLWSSRVKSSGLGLEVMFISDPW